MSSESDASGSDVERGEGKRKAVIGSDSEPEEKESGDEKLVSKYIYNRWFFKMYERNLVSSKKL